MTELFELADTIVKIGLGALISGVTTYIVSTKNQNHELQKEIKLEKKRLLIEAVNKIDSAGILRNESKLIMNRLTKIERTEPKNLQDGLGKLWEAFNLVTQAESYFRLIGNIQLAELAKEYYEAIGEYHKAISLNGWSGSLQIGQSNNKCVEIKARILQQYELSVNKIYA